MNEHVSSSATSRRQRGRDQLLATRPASPAVEVTRPGSIGAPGALPLVLEAANEHADLAAWIRANRPYVHEAVVAHGGVLFRGFPLSSPAGFREAAMAVSDDLLTYHEPSSPRTAVGDRLYTSTEYPASQWIQLHNELSYSDTWPRWILFFCEVPASAGGETPIADSREVYRHLSADLRERFERTGVMYVRNFEAGLDLPWQRVFDTDDRGVVEARCRRAGIQFEWNGERLTTRQVRPAAIRHPETHEHVWFNQAHAFHASVLDPRVRESLLAEMTIGDLPRNAYYGDGTPIEDAAIAAIRDAYARASVRFSWRRGDLLLLDNVMTAHGRAPYEGARRVLTTMAGRLSEAGPHQPERF